MSSETKTLSRQRKVKCDNKQPCENCVKREHPQLCSYKPNRSSASKQASVSTESHQGKKRPHSPDDSVSNDQGSDHQPEGWPQAIGVLRQIPIYQFALISMCHEDEPESLEISRYVGQNSIPALLRDQPSPIETKDGVDIRRDMRPILGLDNSAPFPLMSSKHLDRLTQDIFSELPSDREVMMLVLNRNNYLVTDVMRHVLIRLLIASLERIKKLPIHFGGLLLTLMT